jgi:hypothetical protein
VSRFCRISRLSRAKLTDQVINLNKGIYISILSLLLEPFITVNLYV